MFKHDGKWVYFNSKEEIDLMASKSMCRIKIVNWTSIGWYFITNYQQKCPRGCCYDSVIEFTHKSDRMNAIRKEMRNLAGLLRSAPTEKI